MEKKADMLVGTNGPKTFGSDHADMLICLPNQSEINVSGTKKQVATKIIQLVKDNFFENKQQPYENKSKNIR